MESRKHKGQRLTLVIFIINLMVLLKSYAAQLDSSSNYELDASSSDQILLDSDCMQWSKCMSRQRVHRKMDSSSSCFCDDQCKAYDDCCSDYKSRDKKKPKTDQKFKCHKISDDFGDIQILAHCPDDWFVDAYDLSPKLIKMIERRCHLGANHNDTNEALIEDIDSDPIGLMMPITDRASGVTYANTYCLRCHHEKNRRMARVNKTPFQTPDFVSWNPKLECSFNSNDDLKSLSNFIRVNKGEALKFSAESRKWTINSELASDLVKKIDSNQEPQNETSKRERSCSVVPDGANQYDLVRFCNVDTINSCPRDYNNSDSTIQECESGTRTLIFHKSKAELSYRNLACAVCNGQTEETISCQSAKLTANPKDNPEFLKRLTSTGLAGRNHNVQPAFSTAFAILFDITPSSKNGDTVGIIDCPGNYQVYDPFFMACRCLVCGLTQRYRDGRCVYIWRATTPKNASDSFTLTEGMMTQIDTVDISDKPEYKKRWARMRPEDAEHERFLNMLDFSKLPQASDKSQEIFSKCSKTRLTKRDKYHLFAFSKSFKANKGLGSEEPPIVLLPQNETVKEDQVWAYVPSHQLILASNEFELAKTEYGYINDRRWEENDADLLVCSSYTEHWSKKFSSEMAQVTSICLTISIVSLILYLILYLISTIDLRRLNVELDVAEYHSKSLDETKRSESSDFNIDKRRPNRISVTQGPIKSGHSHRSLSSRGVACLALSLLIAYVLFILSYKPISNSVEPSDKYEWDCKLMAIGTNYCFLVAFTWMFLLSYDTWRTLRRACRLLGPAKHSQFMRFSIYLLVSLLIPATIVGISILFDYAPVICSNQDQKLGQPTCSEFESNLDAFVKSYRPKYGRIKAAGVCWFMSRNSLALFFGLPISIIVAINLVWFLHCSWMVIQTTTRTARLEKGHKHSKPLTIAPLGARKESKQKEFKRRRASREDLEKSMYSSSDIRCTEDRYSSSSEDEIPPIDHPQALAKKNILNSCNKFDVLNPTLIEKLADNESKKTDSNLYLIGADHNSKPKPDLNVEQWRLLMNKVIQNYKLYCRLSCMMGLTWLVGLMASWVDKSPILWHLFIILNALQGFFIFVAFGIQDSKLENPTTIMKYIRLKLSALVDRVISIFGLQRKPSESMSNPPIPIQIQQQETDETDYNTKL